MIVVWLGILSLRGGAKYLAYVRGELAKLPADFEPFVSIIAPCRGLDANLRQNLRALFEQNYPVYEIVFVVDDAGDEAVAVIEDLRREFGGTISSKIVVAGKAVESGQKVHNLRSAVLQVSRQTKVLAFVDSDARPTANWLRFLVAPLADETIGAATGYRWFVGEKRNFATELRAVWNASIASALGANSRKNFSWGGATTIRVETFERIEMLEKWRGTLSDDFVLTRAVQAANLPIHFVPQCLTVSIEDCTWRELIEFTTRQMKITRVYHAHLWKASLIGSFLFTTVFWTNVFLAIYEAIFDFSVGLPLAFVVMIFLLGAWKADLRLRAVKLALPDYRPELDQSWFSQTVLWTLAPPLYLYNCLAAAVSRRISWRGIEYDLKSPTETVMIKRSQVESLNAKQDRTIR